MKECVNEELLQQYFDGELSGKQLESTALHLAGCSTCAAVFQELESENVMLASALALEFDGAVPTERLQRRVEAAIAGLQLLNPGHAGTSRSSLGDWLRSLTALAALSPQRAFGYAGLAAVLLFATIFGVTRWQSATPSQPEIAKTSTLPGKLPTPKEPTLVDSTPIQTPVIPTGLSGPKRVVPRRIRKTAVDTVPQTVAAASNPAAVKLLPGERSYLKTIAALDTSIKSGRNMRPALQAEYERNLALVDRAIAATRSAAKRNPNDPDAAEFMFAAYQSKVDLLNTIADARLYNRR